MFTIDFTLSLHKLKAKMKAIESKINDETSETENEY